jgi:hypothetical protein
MTPYFRQLLCLAAMTLIGFALFVLLFWAGAGASITILFYRGTLLAIGASVLTGLAAIWLAGRTGDSSLPIAAAALSLSFNLCFLVLLPVTVDRSVSVYLLSTIERQQGRGIDPQQLQKAFITGYVVNMGAVDRRIDEQVKSGNLAVGRDGRVRLTPQGRRFMDFSRIVERLFGTDPRFVGETGHTTRCEVPQQKGEARPDGCG